VRTCIPRLVHLTEYPPEVCGPRLAEIQSRRGGGSRRRAHRVEEQPGRERPHLRTPDPDPRVGHGVAHVPAACLRSCGNLRTAMSRTIESGSGRKPWRQFAARSVAIRGRSSDAMTPSIWRHISPPGCSEMTRPSRLNSDAVLVGVNALRCASTVRAARPAGVDTACAPLGFDIYAMVEV